MKKNIRILNLFLCALLAVNLLGVFTTTKAGAETNQGKIKGVEKVVSATNKTIKLSWNKVPGATGYKVFKNTKKQFGKVKPKTVQQSKITFKQLKRGKTYYFKVCSVNNISGKNKLGPATYISARIPAKVKAPNFAKVIRNSLTFGFDCFDGHANTDQETYFTINEYEDYYLINTPGVRTKKDMKKYANKYYSERIVKSLMKTQNYIEKEDGLYVQHGGIGASAFLSCSLNVYKVNNWKYKVFLIGKDDFGEMQKDIQLVYENNRWVVDTQETYSFYDNVDIDVTMVDKKTYKQLVKEQANTYY